MAFPKLLQRLFQNNGAGDKLNQDIIPDIPYSKITDAPSITVDSALSSTSENPVQNKVVKSALDEKLSLSGGTMTGTLVMPYGANSITGPVSEGFVQINAAGNSGGGQLRLYGKDNTQYPGCVFIYAKNGDAPEKALVLKGTGGLEWDGKNVLTGNSAGLTVVAESYGANSWYRKYSDGWIEQGGIFYYSTSTWPSNNNRVTLAIPFSTAVYGYAIGGPASVTGSYNTGGESDNTYYATVSFAGVNKTQVLFSVSQQHDSANAALSIPVVAWGK